MQELEKYLISIREKEGDQLGDDGARYKAVEFGGPIVERMSLDSRLTLTNMSVEMGAKNGIIEPSELPPSKLGGILRFFKHR